MHACFWSVTVTCLWGDWCGACNDNVSGSGDAVLVEESALVEEKGNGNGNGNGQGDGNGDGNDYGNGNSDGNGNGDGNLPFYEW